MLALQGKKIAKFFQVYKIKTIFGYCCPMAEQCLHIGGTAAYSGSLSYPVCWIHIEQEGRKNKILQFIAWALLV